MKDAALRAEVQTWLAGLLRDPIVQTLLKRSHLTKTQAETFLIDVLADKMGEKRLIYEDKARLRLIKAGVTRGAFNRTLAQARRNIINSIYTVILLGYLGVLEHPRLDPYVEIANKIHEYSEAYRDAWNNKTLSNEHIRVINMLQEEIERGLQNLSKPKSMSKRT